MMAAAVPVATYRLQLSAAFTFDDAAKLVPYLRALGISHLYASPFLKARAGSTHGYDIIDHNTINAEFGGEAGFERLSAALKAADIGLILDFVPNHMGVGFADNAWWLDVLEWGEKSSYAAAFDIDWDLLPHRHGGGVLAPILGTPYGRALENGEIVLKYDPAEGSFSAWYYEHRLPIRPDRYGEILRGIVNAATAGNEPAGRRLLEIAALHRHPRAPSRSEAPAFKAALAAIEDGAQVIERGIHIFRPLPEHPDSALPLHRLLERQHYRIAHWKLAGNEINYRRFFDINSLAGLRVEDLDTFRRVHDLVARLIADDKLQGLRLDHIDGLWDPIQYARRLQRLIRAAQGGSRRPFYVIVEKILAEGERMPELPGVAGTTGYEWLNVISRVLVDDTALAPLDRFRREATDNPRPFRQIVERAKARVLDNLLSSEFTVLARLLMRIAAGHYRTRDFTAARLEAALRLFVIEFPVYRTYINSITAGPSPEDRATIDRAIVAARARWFGADTEIFDFLRDVITLDLIAPGRTGYSGARVKRFAFKLQQFTGPMMAKSLEDTAFYRYFRLLALNEVGGDPAAGGLSPREFHERMKARAAEAPHGLTATATHDTKRGEDARMRVLAIAELSNEWMPAVHAWQGLNARFANNTGDARAPSLGVEYMLYQTLIGAWPLEGVTESFIERMEAYAIKAAREGKVDTSWINPDEAYEAALKRFVRSILSAAESTEFIESFGAFAQRTALLGALNSLSQLALKLTMPGVPDVYQGTELWDLSLVDPDNRRPVDFAARVVALERATTPDWHAVAAAWPDGAIKFALLRELLPLRNQHASLFVEGAYQPVEVVGAHRDHVVAFARVSGPDAIVVAAGRHFAPFTDGGRQWPSPAAWDAELVLDGFSSLRAPHAADSLPLPRVPISGLFDPLPVAILRATIGRRSDRIRRSAPSVVEPVVAAG
jgi:(1->4)-alpha-D-glucan 1-alpha-D-glucosylmutase